MFKIKILPVLLLGIMLIASCAMNQGIYEPAIEQSPEIEQQATAIDATAVETRGLPITKEVTVYKYHTMRLHRSKIGETFNGIRNGSMSTYYNDGTYKGTIKSTAFTVTGPPQGNGDYITFPLKVTYTGKVYTNN